SAAAQLLAFVREGIRHIWLGIDHILFLLALLIPSVLLRRDGGAGVSGGAGGQRGGGTGGQRGGGAPAAVGEWTAAPRFAPVFKDVLKVVTAFTVAHSITLALSVLGLVQLPSRFVETAIAVSVLLAALNNVIPVVDGRWTVAFALGLLHG